MNNDHLIDPKIDAASRFLNGDWQGESFDSLKASGKIHRSPDYWAFWRCSTTGADYTQSAICAARLRARYAKELETRQLAQDTKKQKAGKANV